MKGINKLGLFATIFLILMLLLNHGIIIAVKADGSLVSSKECTEKPQEKKVGDKHSLPLTEIQYRVSYEELG
jgi:hypothetical protein